MKKAFLLFLSAATLLTSCSDETSNEERVNFQAKSGGNDLSLLFNEMSESNEYLDMSEAIHVFIDKLNIDSNIILEKEGDLLNWGQANISTTGFTDYKELLDDWSEIKNKQTLVLTKHHIFFSEVVENYPDMDYGSTDSPYDETDACLCLPQLNDCYQAADQTRNNGIYSTMIISGTSGGGREAGISLAVANHDRNIRNCNSIYEACLKNCK
jgi:hypothetical protein